MWYGIMKEFDCKVSSTWSVCEREKEEAFTHKHSSPEKEENLQLDNIIGPMRRNDEIYIHNGVRLWDTWDHYTKFARVQEKTHTQRSSKKSIKRGRGGNR